MGNPLLLIDRLISTKQFSSWVYVHEEEKEERIMWDYYTMKLGAWDDRSFDDFRNGIKRSRPQFTNGNQSTKEQLVATVSKSFDILSSFNPEGSS